MINTRNAYLAGLLDRGLSFKMKMRVYTNGRKVKQPIFRVALINGAEPLKRLKLFGGNVYTYTYPINGIRKSISYYATADKATMKAICRAVKPYMRNTKRIKKLNKTLQQLRRI